MEFTLGDIIVLAAVAIVLFIYRQLDRNNQSLAKVKRFTDKVRRDLSGLIDSKTEELKNLTIELDVHMKTAREILKRVNNIEGDLKGRTKGVDDIHRRIAEYDKALVDLVNMTQKVDENLTRLHDESQFVDTVGKRVRDAISQMAQIEKGIPELKEKFAKENFEQLKSITGKVTQATEELVGSISGEVARAHESITEFANHTAKLEATRDGMEEETVSNLRNRFQELVVEADDLRDKLLDRFKADLGILLDQEEEKARELINEIQGRHQTLRGEIESTEVQLNEKLETFQDRITRTEDDYQRALHEAAEKGRSLEDEIFISLKEHVEVRARGVENSLSGLMNASKERLESSRKELVQMFGETRSQITVWRAELQKKMDESALEVEQKYESFSGEIETRMDSILSDTGKTQVQRAEELAGFIESTRTEIDALEGNLRQRLSGLKESIQSNEDGFKSVVDAAIRENRESVESVREDTANQITHFEEELVTRFSTIEGKIDEYEDSVRYRLDKVDQVHADIEALEESMKKNIDLAVGQARTSLQAALERIGEDRTQEKKHAEAQLEEIRRSMDAIDGELTALKSKAYANVSEKLQVFEDDFFTDLKGRNEAMRVSVEEWQGGMTDKMQEISEAQVRDRQEAEERFTTALKAKFAGLQGDMSSQYERFSTSVIEFQNQLETRMGGAEGDLEGLEERIKADMTDLKRASETVMESELSSFSSGVNEQLKEHRNEVDSNLRVLGERVEEGTQSIDEMLQSAKADVTEWQEKMLEQMGAAKVDVSEDFESFKESIQSQQEDVIAATDEGNRVLRVDLEETRNIVTRAEQDLASMSQEYKEEFSTSADTFLTDFRKNVTDMQTAAGETVRDFKSQVADVRGKIEGVQNRLEQKIGDGYKRLSSSLEEIDRKQRDFVGQTKVFERADTLRESLEKSIETLKADIGQLDEHRTDLRDVEKEFNRVRKLGEDASEKVGRFVAEKRRIDSMDEDFKRLITISQSIDVKLEQVTSSHDSVQEIQASIRNLGELEGEVARRYERLESRKTIIDATTEGVDANFGKLETLQGRIRDVEGGLAPFADRIDEIAGRMDTLEGGKAEAERVIALMADLDTTLSGVEERIETMQQAREWLARTETRLSEVSKQAEEQVKLMGSLLKEGSKQGRKERGAPSLTSRDMVIRLAHQGWKVEQIIQATKLSRGEVELILELSSKK
jgi:chromosome segregation ATPase